MVGFSLKDLQWVETQIITMMDSLIPRVGDRLPNICVKLIISIEE